MNVSLHPINSVLLMWMGMCEFCDVNLVKTVTKASCCLHRDHSHYRVTQVTSEPDCCCQLSPRCCCCGVVDCRASPHRCWGCVSVFLSCAELCRCGVVCYMPSSRPTRALVGKLLVIPSVTLVHTLMSGSSQYDGSLKSMRKIIHGQEAGSQLVQCVLL